MLCKALYQDELKPYGRILRKRLLDQDMAVGLASNEAGLAHLRTACEAVKELRIEPAQGGQWIAYLEGRDVDFVDVYSPLDFYPEELWMQAKAYFESLCEPECILPGGRFSCAACLIERKLRFLSGHSLRKVCHIVRLAVSQKKLLGYCNEGITPFGTFKAFRAAPGRAS